MNWLKNFMPKMAMFEENDVIFVEAVCAKRVFRVRYKIAVREARGSKALLKLLKGGENGRFFR